MQRFSSLTKCFKTAVAVSRRTQHYWCTPTHEFVNIRGIQSEEVDVEVGLTDFGVDQIGNIGAINVHAKVGSPLAKGDPIADLSWTGFTITDGDELYHTRWENSKGERPLTAPFPVIEVQEVNEKALEDPDGCIVRGEWLFRMRVKNADVTELMREQDYAHYVEGLAPEGW